MTVPASSTNARPDTRSTDQPAPQTNSAAPLGAAPLRPTHDLMDCFREYAREKPEVVALWCLGIGFVLGWKLKPW